MTKILETAEQFQAITPEAKNDFIVLIGKLAKKQKEEVESQNASLMDEFNYAVKNFTERENPEVVQCPILQSVLKIFPNCDNVQKEAVIKGVIENIADATHYNHKKGIIISNVFKHCNESQQDMLVEMIIDMESETGQKYAIKSVFQHCTEKQKDTFVANIIQFTGLEMKETLDAIRPYCSEEQNKMLDVANMIQEGFDENFNKFFPTFLQKMMSECQNEQQGRQK